MPLFAMLLERGAGWRHGEPLSAQDEWDGHRALMNKLEASGVIVLGGTLDPKPAALLIVRAESEAALRTIFAADPWWGSGLLSPAWIAPLEPRLGAARLAG